MIEKCDNSQRACHGCYAQVPADYPDRKELWKCVLGVEIVWKVINATDAFYCPVCSCARPTSEIALRDILVKMRP